MPHKGKKPAEHLPLTPRTFHILLATKDGVMHGYSIMKEVEKRSAGQVRIGPGTMYEAIGRLVAGDLLKEVAAPASSKTDKRRRRFYKLTPLGRKVMVLEAERLAALVSYVRQEDLLAGA